MATIPRSLSKIIIRLFVVLGVVTACIGVNIGTAAADEIPPAPVITDPIAADPMGGPTADADMSVPCEEPFGDLCIPVPPYGILAINYDTDGSPLATAAVVDDQGNLGGLWVNFTIAGDATFIDGATSIYVYADPTTGLATTSIYPLSNTCGSLNFDVSASLQYGDSEIPLQGSPAHGGFVFPQCSVSMGLSLIPTNSGDVYANGMDSWTGLIQLIGTDGAPITGQADQFSITIYQLMGDAIYPTDAVTASPIIENGDGSYSVLFATLTPGEYTIDVAWQDLTIYGSNWMTFYGTTEPPSITEANGHIITGFTSPATTILVTDSFAATLGIAQSDDEGFWYIPTPVGTPSQMITANVVDESGTILAQSSAWLDTDVPLPPRVDIANTTEVAGFAGAVEPFAPVYITFPNGTTIGFFANEDGSYNLATPAYMIAGVVSVVQLDYAGNESDPTVIDLTITLPLIVGVQSAQIYPGDIQVVTGQNFQPGEKVSALLSTNSTVLAVGFADNTGTVRVSFPIPTDTEVGFLNVILTGAQSGEGAAAFEVLAPVPVQQCWYVTYIKTILKLWLWWR